MLINLKSCSKNANRFEQSIFTTVRHILPDGRPVLRIAAEVVEHGTYDDVQTVLSADMTAAQHVTQGLADVKVGVLHQQQIST